MLWIIVVHIPKAKVEEYRGIELMEPIWKLMEAVINRRLESIRIHDSLHGCVLCRRTSTATAEVKLAQQYAVRQQAVLFHFFFGFVKSI